MIQKELIIVSQQMLSQIKELVNSMKDADYSEPLPLLSGNTIAKHIRHVLEIYNELLKGINLNGINYDARLRDLLIEHNRDYTIQYIDDLIEQLTQLTEDQPIDLKVCFNTHNQTSQVLTSLNRELAYNIEHAIHHMAIMQIAINHAFPYIQLDAQFGVAFSTQSYLQNNVHS